MVTTATLVDLGRVRQLAKSGRAKELREGAHLSLAEIGAFVGVSDVSVLRWERGERRPHGRPALRYLRLLDRLEEQQQGNGDRRPRRRGRPTGHRPHQRGGPAPGGTASGPLDEARSTPGRRYSDAPRTPTGAKAQRNGSRPAFRVDCDRRSPEGDAPMKSKGSQAIRRSREAARQQARRMKDEKRRQRAKEARRRKAAGS